MQESIEYKLGKRQVEIFLNDNLLYIECLIKFNCSRIILNEAYRYLVCVKAITAIEDLPIDEKEKLWLTTKDFCVGRLDLKRAIELSKALYTIEYFLNQ